MNTSSITIENVDFLNDMFPQFSPRLSKVNYIGAVSVFTFSFESENDLYENWKAVTNAIATYYQSEFEDDETEFERWNIYIFFVVKEPVAARLKYKIENNKFSSRKTVQDNVSANVDLELIEQLIKEYIINDDISITASENIKTDDRQSVYINDSEIYETIDNSNLKVLGKKEKKEEIENLYQQILKKIAHEIQESRNSRF